MDFHLRPGTHADNPVVHEVFRDSIDDLVSRKGLAGPEPPDPAERASRWTRLYEPIFRHLTDTAEAFWLAEDGDGIVGYARTTYRDGLRELTELFVAPRAQAAGVGKALLGEAFPAAGAEHLLIMATLDNRAQARYLRSGCYPRFPLLGLYRQPTSTSDAAVGMTLAARALGSAPDVDLLARIDREVLGHRRDVDHGYLAPHRAGFAYEHDGRLVGYGYIAAVPGPVAAVDPAFVPAMLTHLELAAAESGIDELNWEVPGINRAAIDHLLARGYKVGEWYNFVMMNEPFGRFDRYVVSAPTFFV